MTLRLPHVAVGAAMLTVLMGALPAMAASPHCASITEVRGMKILRVENNDVLVLRDGRAADLEGILLPEGRRDHAPMRYKRQAIDALRAIATGHDATMTLERPKEDRYGRLRAQVYFPGQPGDPWVQRVLLERGLARVDIEPDRRECAADLLGFEREARAAHRGIWADPAYAVRTPDRLAGDTGTFQIVEGVVVSADVKSGRAYLNFGRDWRSDFTATIAPEDMANFRKSGHDPRDYQGKRVRVRGWIEAMNGPEIELSAPEQIEVLAPGVMPTPRAEALPVPRYAPEARAEPAQPHRYGRQTEAEQTPPRQVPIMRGIQY